MKRLLILTPMDVVTQTNNREHHLISHLAPRFEETAVVFRRRLERRGLARLLLDALVPRASRHHPRPGLTLVSVNPALNLPQGLAMDMTGTYELLPLGEAARGLRPRLLRLISGAALLKDVSTIIALFLSALLLTRGKFDVCTAMGPYGNAAARLLKIVGKVRAWVYEDRDYEPGFVQTPLRNRFARWLENTGIRYADGCVCIAHQLATLRERETGRGPTIITSGVDADRFTVRERELSNPVLVYTGNVTFWSGLEMVISALPAVRHQIPGVRFRIVGEGLAGYRAGLDAIIREHSLEEAVEFTGRVPNSRVPELLANGHLGVAVFRPLSFRRYAFPLKVLEYMAAGLPCIGSEGMETEDILVRAQCGVTVPFDPKAFATATVGLLTDIARYRAMARNARSAALARYTWSSLMAREYEALESAYERARILKQAR